MNVASLISGEIRSLDRKVESDELVREEDVKDEKKLARLLTRILKDVASLRRRFAPRRIDFEDVDMVLGDNQLPHNLGGRVRWWVVDCEGDLPQLVKQASTDANTLVLFSGTASRMTIRVEEVG